MQLMIWSWFKYLLNSIRVQLRRNNAASYRFILCGDFITKVNYINQVSSQDAQVILVCLSFRWPAVPSMWSWWGKTFPSWRAKSPGRPTHRTRVLASSWRSKSPRRIRSTHQRSDSSPRSGTPTSPPSRALFASTSSRCAARNRNNPPA